MHDITNQNDVKQLVDTFYASVRQDHFLGPIFEERLAGHWESHHEILYRFWHTVIFKEMHYYGNPVPGHFDMNLTASHFESWLKIWTDTVDILFEGKRADNAKLRGKTMGAAFLNKIVKHQKMHMQPKNER